MMNHVDLRRITTTDLPVESGLQHEKVFISPPTDHNWGIHGLGINQLHQKGINGAGVTICIMDSGAMISHPELQGAIDLKRSIDTTGEGLEDLTPSGHGTAVAGVVGARNLRRQVGVAPACEIILAKVLNRDYKGTNKNLLASLNWALEAAPDVVCFPFETDQYNREVNDLLIALSQRGVVLIASAGNQFLRRDCIGYPGAYQPCLTVGGLEAPEVIFEGSAVGRLIDVVAPGAHLITIGKSGYREVQGTSFAAAFVAGVVALVLQSAKEKGKARVREHLHELIWQTSIPLSARGRTMLYGSGSINPPALIEAVANC